MRMYRWMSWLHISSFQPLFRVKWVQWPNRFTAEFFASKEKQFDEETLATFGPISSLIRSCIHIYLLTSLTVYRWTVLTVTILAYLFVFTFFSVNRKLFQTFRVFFSCVYCRHNEKKIPSIYCRKLRFKPNNSSRQFKVSIYGASQYEVLPINTQRWWHDM